MPGDVSADSKRGRGRELLLVAARRVFAEKGYSSAGVREIARAAGVTEPSLYWHFGSKQGLFEAATVDPFRAFLGEYLEGWKQRGPGTKSAVDEASDFLGGLFDALHSQRDLVRNVLAIDDSDPGRSQIMSSLEQLFTSILEVVADRLHAEGLHQGLRPIDSAMWARLVFAAMFSLAVHGPLFNAGHETPRDDAIRELVDMFVYGIAPR